MKIAVIIACLAVLAVLIAGLYSMWKGGDFSRKWSNKLMRLRVMLQAIAIAIIMIGFFLARHR
ncbi:MAG TPA: twin transmembrane helix small protein [Alphaproteobacteria bacterium]|nr:twin transmembrane helix small protein [Alphaproteobacteria bacterium]